MTYGAKLSPACRGSLSSGGGRSGPGANGLCSSATSVGTTQRSSALPPIGFFGLRPTAPGVSDVALVFHVDADETAFGEVLEAARGLSPVHDTVTTPRRVDLSLAANAPEAV